MGDTADRVRQGLREALAHAEAGAADIINLPPIHPGELLSDELEALHMSARQFAAHLHVPTQAVTAILSGRRGVTAPMALRLGQAFGTGPGYWMRLQGMYEVKIARAKLRADLERIGRLGNNPHEP